MVNVRLDLTAESEVILEPKPSKDPNDPLVSITDSKLANGDDTNSHRLSELVQMEETLELRPRLILCCDGHGIVSNNIH